MAKGGNIYALGQISLAPGAADPRLISWANAGVHELSQATGATRAKLILQCGEAFPDGVLGEFSNAMRFQLIHNLLAVGIHCLDADLQ